MILHDPLLLKKHCLINGDWVGTATQAAIRVINPATGELVGVVPALDVTDIETAITAAAAAFPAWRARTARERGGILRRWFDLILAHADDLALIMTSEQGKPLAEAKSEIAYAASFVEWFAEEAKRIYGDTIASPRADQRLTVLRQPIGVTAAITPWNFPAAMITRKVAPALAAGCTMIVRPADLTPLTALALGELAVRAGIPTGVLQIVTGDARTIGTALTASTTVRKLSFTGSTAVGRLLMAQCALSIKRLSLELGGNAPFIVFDDADVDAAIDGVMVSKFRNAGQTCVCANRILVQTGIHTVFVAKLLARVAALRVGQGIEANVTIGPLITATAVTNMTRLIADALGKGATLCAGGHIHQRGGQFFEPTVLTGVTADMAVAREEIFGPIAAIMAFTSEAEAIGIANDTDAGLAAYFYTRDAQRAIRVSEALEYGMVGHNTGLISNEVAPFGGVKQSGLGREGSRYGIDEYLEMKYICTAITA